MLPIICIALVLRLAHATGGARVLIRTSWGLRQRLVATWAEFQHSVVYYATDQCRKRLEACINAEGGQSEHLLWHCLPDIPVATRHNRFQSHRRQPTTGSLHSIQRFERTQQTFSEMKKFCNSQVSVVIFSGGVGKRITVFFFWDNTNNHNYAWIILLKMTFFRFPKVKWLHLTGEVDKSVTFHVKSSQNLTCQKSLKSVNFWQSFFK